jgi:predicted amino acid dehydrogenase
MNDYTKAVRTQQTYKELQSNPHREEIINLTLEQLQDDIDFYGDTCSD